MGAAAIDQVVEFDRVAKTYDRRSRVVDDLNLSIMRADRLRTAVPE